MTNAPAIPRRVVRMKPCGSWVSPGVINLAKTPATKPITIVQRIHIMSASLDSDTDQPTTKRVPIEADAPHITARSSLPLPMMRLNADHGEEEGREFNL